MSYIPDCREDEYYNEKYLQGADADFVAGYDYATMVGVNPIFANCEIFDNYADEEENTDAEDNIDYRELSKDITPNNLFKVFRARKDLAEHLQECINNYIEIERDKMVMSMIDRMDNLEDTKAVIDASHKKNAVLLLRDSIGSYFE